MVKIKLEKIHHVSALIPTLLVCATLILTGCDSHKENSQNNMSNDNNSSNNNSDTDNKNQNRHLPPSKTALSEKNNSLQLSSQTQKKITGFQSDSSMSSLAHINVEKGLGQLKWNSPASLIKDAKESPAMEKETKDVIGVAYNCYVSSHEQDDFLQKMEKIQTDNINKTDATLFGYCFKANHFALGVELSSNPAFYDTLYHWHETHYPKMKNETMLRIKSSNSQWLIKNHNQVLGSLFYRSENGHVTMWFVDNIPVTLKNLTAKEIQQIQSEQNEKDDSGSPDTPSSS